MNNYAQPFVVKRQSLYAGQTGLELWDLSDLDAVSERWDSRCGLMCRPEPPSQSSI